MLGLLNCFLSFISSAAKQRLSQQGSLLAKKQCLMQNLELRKFAALFHPPKTVVIKNLQLFLMPTRLLQNLAVELTLKTAVAAFHNAPRTALKLNSAFI